MTGAKLLRNVGRVTLTGGKNLIPVPWKTGTKSTQPGILGRAAARFNVTSLPIIPSGTAGTVPDQDAVWAGIFGQAATSAVYSFSDSTFAPFALIDYQHGVSTLTSQILYGCTPEDVTVRFNTDYLSMDMSGSGIYLLDSDNFANEDTTGKGGLSSFPTEPSSPTTTGSIIVGFTGSATFDSNVMSAATALIRGWTLRIRTGYRVIGDGFGDAYGQLQVGGAREVSMGFDFVDSDAAELVNLKVKAKQKTPLNITAVIGTVAGFIVTFTAKQFQLVYPEFTDQSDFVQTAFAESPAHATAVGSIDDLTVAFT